MSKFKVHNCQISGRIAANFYQPVFAVPHFLLRLILLRLRVQAAPGESMLKRDMNIADFDPELWQAITQETDRQEAHIELIASEIAFLNFSFST